MPNTKKLRRTNRVTIWVTKETRQKLNVLAAEKGVSVMKFLDELLKV